MKVKDTKELLKDIQARVEQGEVLYLHNKHHSTVTLLHPSGDDYKSLSIRGNEYRPLDFDPEEIKVWLRSAQLRGKLSNGVFEIVDEDEVVYPVSLPPELRLGDEHSEETMRQILGINEAHAKNLIELIDTPLKENQPSWLKYKHLPVLRAVQYIEERQGKRKWMLDLLKKNIKRMEQLPG